jgi:hypothetical protein
MFDSVAFRDVAVHSPISTKASVGVQNRNPVGLQYHQVALLVPVDVSEAPIRFALGSDRVTYRRYPGTFVGRHEIEGSLADDLSWFITKDVSALRTGVRVNRIRIHLPYPIIGRTDQMTQAFFTVVDELLGALAICNVQTCAAERYYLSGGIASHFTT